jgi:hypothetical protein
MGLDIASIKLLCCAKNLGADFSDTLMVGRQSINEDTATILPVLSKIGINALDIKRGDYGEDLFRLFGASQVDSLDGSSYEKATFVHDLNHPTPPHLSERFSIVHDGGTLEHVFNLPQALKTCMEMVRVGGHFIQVTVANNYMGHGFWQLSPDVIYAALSPENGFQIKAVFLHEVIPSGAWYFVVGDPSTLSARIELCNAAPTYICTIAQRIAVKEIYATVPQQVHYSNQWVAPGPSHHAAANEPHVAANEPQPFSIRKLIPKPVKNALRSGLNAFKPKPPTDPFAKPCYRRISDDDLIFGRV